MRIRRAAFLAAVAAGLAAMPLSTAKAQPYPQQSRPTAGRTADQLNREELTRLQSGNGYSLYYSASGSPSGSASLSGSASPSGGGYPWGPGWAYPACSSPFPLFWPFCVIGAVVDAAATIVTVPVSPDISPEGGIATGMLVCGRGGEAWAVFGGMHSHRVLLLRVRDGW